MPPGTQETLPTHAASLVEDLGSMTRPSIGRPKKHVKGSMLLSNSRPCMLDPRSSLRRSSTSSKHRQRNSSSGAITGSNDCDAVFCIDCMSQQGYTTIVPASRSLTPGPVETAGSGSPGAAPGRSRAGTARAWRGAAPWSGRRHRLAHGAPLRLLAPASHPQSSGSRRSINSRVACAHCTASLAAT